MNHWTIDLYAHNRGTRRYGVPSQADLTPTVTMACPFCGKTVTSRGGQLDLHAERFGPWRCPASNLSTGEAQRLAGQLTADFMLPGECNLG